MSDPTNDIDALLAALDWGSGALTNEEMLDRSHAALTALVAERDSLSAELAAARKEREEANEECREATLASERGANEALDLSRELAAMRERVAAQDADIKTLAASNAILHGRLESHPPADRDRELRERLLESALQGAGCRMGIMEESDAEELGRQAVWIVNGALAEMRKEASDGK